MLFIVVLFIVCSVSPVTPILYDGSNSLRPPDSYQCPLSEPFNDLEQSLLRQENKDHRENSARLQKQEGGVEGGWFIPHTYSEFTGPCNIRKVNWTLSNQEFVNRYAYTEPVILVGLSDQSEFKHYSTRQQLLSDYGNDLITVTTANTYSYPKVKMTLREYVDKVMKPQQPGVLGKDTLYHFGDNDRVAWADLFSRYHMPSYSIPSLEPVLSFGLAGPGTGVPFHVHGPTFAETIYGRKRWFLYPPEVTPVFDPDVSTLDWVTDVYPNLPPQSKPIECVLHPGEIIFFPNMWWHATLNLDAAVFMSTFLA